MQDLTWFKADPYASSCGPRIGPVPDHCVHRTLIIARQIERYYPLAAD
jgi:hypothetical protein